MRSPTLMPCAAVSTYCAVPSSILMPNRRIVVPPVAADGGSAVMVSTRPKPGRRALGATAPGALCCTTTGSALTTGAGAGTTTTGAGAGATGSELAHAPSTATAASDKGKENLL